MTKTSFVENENKFIERRNLPRFRFNTQVWNELHNQPDAGMDKASFDKTINELDINKWKFPKKRNYIINYDQLIDILNGKQDDKKEVIQRQLPIFKLESSIINEILSDTDTAATEPFIKEIIRKANALHFPENEDVEEEVDPIVNYDKLINYLYGNQ